MVKKNTIPRLPIDIDIESKRILKKAASAHRALAELKGIAESIPNQGILINTLILQEAKDSSEIENIITTHDEMYKAELFGGIANSAAKEVQNYAQALRIGFQKVLVNKIFTNNIIKDIHEILEENNAGFRKLPGTNLKNDATGEVIYTPPQTYKEITELMSNLEQFINDDDISDLDPLVKMAIIHHQFESIHPFYDGNGRAGRIINILYLVLKGLLNIPTLYLSRYIIQTKSTYYNLLQKVRDTNEWEEWILYILTGVELTSRQTTVMVLEIKELMKSYKKEIRAKFPKIYSQDLLNNLFRHPYTKIEFVEKDLQISRLTAKKYLEQLTQAGFLEKRKIWRSYYYINHRLFDLLRRTSTF